MFESIMVKSVKPTNVNWISPKLIELTLPGEDKPTTYSILKGAENFLHSKMDVKPATSAEVYKKSDYIWRTLRDEQLSKLSLLEKEDKNYFTFTKPTVTYLIDDYHNLVDMYEAGSELSLDNFDEKLEQFRIDISTFERTRKFFSEGSNGLTKLVCYSNKASLPDEDYTPIVIIEFNTSKSVYRVYTGILIYKSFTFIPTSSRYIDTKSYADLVNYLNIGDTLEYSKEASEELYNAYLKLRDEKLEISVRELMSILSKVGYKIELKNDEEIGEIDKLQDEEGNIRLQEFFNTFRFTTGENAHDILTLSELSKVFRYNKLTMMEVLTILSKEYLNTDGCKITADILGDILTNMLYRRVDKGQADKIKKEINKDEDE